MNILSLILGAIGLTIDIIGVVILFFLRDKGLSEISLLKVRITPSLGNWDNDVDKKIRYQLDDFAKDINSIINTTNRNNEKQFKKSQKLLWVIILGFVLQLLSVILQLITILTTT